MRNWHYEQYIDSAVVYVSLGLYVGIYARNYVATRAFDLPANSLYNRD